MKKGEKCILECKPDYAYGAQGSPPKIPANSTLKFEVELLSWNDLEKLSDGLFKKVLVEADRPSFQTPISRSVVKGSSTLMNIHGGSANDFLHLCLHAFFPASVIQGHA